VNGNNKHETGASDIKEHYLPFACKQPWPVQTHHTMGDLSFRKCRIASFVLILCPFARSQGREWIRIENTELLYPHLKIGHDAAMRSTITAMEGQRVTVQQQILSTPIEPVVLEDETVEDDADPPDVADMHMTLPHEPQENALEHVVQSIDHNENETDLEMIPSEEAQQMTNGDTVGHHDVDKLLMPPPPPRTAATARPLASSCNEIQDEATIPPSFVEPPVTASVEVPVSSTGGFVPEPVPLPPRPPTPPPLDEDATEREALLRQLDLLRLKFKQSVIPPAHAHLEHYKAACSRHRNQDDASRAVDC
jgi:hypothetical protein